MPYCDLNRMRVERFATLEDLDRYTCTVEEREEYEHLVVKGSRFMRGGLRSDFTGRGKGSPGDPVGRGNNDFSFYRSDLEIVILDPHRPGHESLYIRGR